ncbi:MAG: hypothetical protein K2I07_02425 [Lachnospiraceae bacterium]|nr:hypothetical protein [Lachnospiraceae bacterium]
MKDLLIGSSVLILFVILLRMVMGGKISFRMRYALWLIVALRLALPFALPGSPLSIMNYVPSLQALFYEEAESSGYAGSRDAGSAAAEENGYGDDLLSGQEGKSAMLTVRQGAAVVRLDDTAQDVPAQNVSMRQETRGLQDGAMVGNTLTERAAGTVALKNRLCIVWLIGAVIMSLYLLTVNIRLYRQLHRARVLMSSGRWAKDGRTLPVYCCEKLATPCLFGVCRPAIYLNATALADEKNHAFALAHEQQHYRHKDHIWSFVRLVCLTVYWFHPLVWAAAILSAKDCELACDEGVTAQITKEECAEYGRSLLSQVPLRRGRMYLTATTSMSSSARTLKRRLLAITQKKKASVRAAFLTAAMLLFVAGCTFTGADDRSANMGNDDAAGLAAEGGEGENVTDAGSADENGMDEPAQPISPDAELLSKLKESIQIDADGTLTFTIPVSDHAPEDWSISITGKQSVGDGDRITSFVEHGQEGYIWESGKTFSLTIGGSDSDMAELSMDITLSSFSEDGEEIRTSTDMDLLACWRERSEPDADESMMQTALKAFVLFPDGRHGWALTEDDQILYTYEGVGQFSFVSSLPFAQAGEASDAADAPVSFLADRGGTEVSVCFLDEKTAYFAAVSAIDGEALLIRVTIMSEPAAGDENGQVLVSEHRTRIPLQEYYWCGEMYVSFADSQNGYLLVCSDPALGQMAKHLYRTTDGGDSFSFAADLSTVIRGYPSGMAFCDEETGYIGVNSRGEENYLYGTTDGGKTWESVDVPVHTDAYYSDSLAPVVFYEDGTPKMAVVLKNVVEPSNRYVLYINPRPADFMTWRLIRILPYDDVRSFCLTDKNTGYFIDGDGLLQKWEYDGN